MSVSALDSAVGLVGWLALCFGSAAIGSRYRPDTWYAALEKPAWNPPDWVFAPVWTVLYTLMAVAAWMVWRQAGFAVELAPFAVQLLLNAAWTWLFFGRHRPGLALADLAALWFAILATLIGFWRVLPLAGALLLPYLAWVGFAGALNAALWRRNRPGPHG